jgi:uncharacterized protein DUF3137
MNFSSNVQSAEKSRYFLWIHRDPMTIANKTSSMVWSTDQIAARALLTPAFMERLLALNGPASNIDGRPLVVARDNRLTLVIPRSGRDHFLAPGFREAAASRASLIALHDQIAGVLAVADAVIDLDQAARTVAADMSS